jgi:hypothetical protein
MPITRLLPYALLAALTTFVVPASADTALVYSDEILLFEEGFEDTDFEARGWYDSPHMEITAAEHIVGSGHACQWHWVRAGDINTRGGGARVRLPPVEDVTLSFYIKHSPNWRWTGVDWHPHEFHFITNADPAFISPAYTHLTFYVEAVNGVPRLAIQDGRNIDEERIGQDLVAHTEQRAVAGCNGDSDDHGRDDCYSSGEVHVNGKYWAPDRVYFGDATGPYDKAAWHHVQARFRLNTIQDGVGQRDGILQYWFDGEPVIDHRDVVLRTGAHPNMKIDQFLMAPYYGPGVPHEQHIWIDQLRITTGTPNVTTQVNGASSTWGQVKAVTDQTD